MDGTRRSWHRIAIWGFVFFIVLYIFVAPISQHLTSVYANQNSLIKLGARPLVETITQQAIETLFALMFFSFGASVGSFINVVVYRMPLNKSITFQSSHCPMCGKHIQVRDNLPVFGWLVLKGRCRSCKSPISARYPIVESIVGSIFLVLFLRELISSGANLPFREINSRVGVVWTILDTKWDLLATYLYHCLWLVFLVIWTLFAWDGTRIPQRAFVFALFALAVLPIVLNYLSIVPFDYLGGRSRLAMSQLTIVALNGAIGGAVGLLLGSLLISRLSFLIAGYQVKTQNRLTISNMDPDRESAKIENHAVDALEETEQLTQATELRIVSHDADLLLTDQPNLDVFLLQEQREAALPALAFRDAVNASMVCTGLAVGWQALVGIVVITVIWRAICLIEPLKQVWNWIPFTGWFLTASIIHHLFWRQLSGLW